MPKSKNAQKHQGAVVLRKNKQQPTNPLPPTPPSQALATPRARKNTVARQKASGSSSSSRGGTFVVQGMRQHAYGKGTVTGCLVSGKAFIDVVSGTRQDSISSPKTRVAVSRYIHPDMFDYRLFAFGNLFEQYKFLRLKFHFVPYASTNSSGLLTMVVVKDPDINPISLIDLDLRSWTENVANSSQGNILKASSLVMKPDASDDFYHCYREGSSLNSLYQGKFMATITSADIAPGYYGDIYVEYECLFLGDLFTTVLPPLSSGHSGREFKVTLNVPVAAQGADIYFGSIDKASLPDDATPGVYSFRPIDDVTAADVVNAPPVPVWPEGVMARGTNFLANLWKNGETSPNPWNIQVGIDVAGVMSKSFAKWGVPISVAKQYGFLMSQIIGQMG